MQLDGLVGDDDDVDEAVLSVVGAE